LTGLLNRVAFDRALDTATRPAVLVADLDHFKQVNDHYGHLAGDDALRALSSELLQRTPATPFYRFGGDELTCVLAEADAESAWRTAEMVCAVGRRVLAPWGTAVTVGVAASRPGEAPRSTLGRADTALLWAKRNARGTAAVAPDGLAGEGLLSSWPCDVAVGSLA
jgi:two-component system, cell cycle response regulator